MKEAFEAAEKEIAMRRAGRINWTTWRGPDFAEEEKQKAEAARKKAAAEAKQRAKAEARAKAKAQQKARVEPVLTALVKSFKSFCIAQSLQFS